MCQICVYSISQLKLVTTEQEMLEKCLHHCLQGQFHLIDVLLLCCVVLLYVTFIDADGNFANIGLSTVVE